MEWNILNKLNMKKLLFFALILCSIFSFSQNYKKKMAQDVCSKLKKMDFSNKSQKRIQMEFGLLMIKSAAPYKEELKKDMGIDLVNDIANEEKLEKFGTEVGILVASECPDTFMDVVSSSEELYNEMVDSQGIEPSVSLVSGEVVKIEKGNFVVFYIKGDNGILHQYYWVGKIDSNIDLPKEYQNLAKKKVFIGYHKNTIYDASLNAYKNINEIHRLTVEE